MSSSGTIMTQLLLASAFGTICALQLGTILGGFYNAILFVALLWLFIGIVGSAYYVVNRLMQ